MVTSRLLKKSVISPARPEAATTASLPRDAPFPWRCSRIALETREASACGEKPRAQRERMKGSLWPWYGNDVCLGTRRVCGCDRAFLTSLLGLCVWAITFHFILFSEG